MKKQIKVWGLVGLVAVVVLVAGTMLFRARKVEVEPEVYRIGAILPLTGPLAFFGEYQMNAIEIAVEEINNRGGIRGRQIVVVFEDHKNDPKKGVTAIHRIANMKRIPVAITQMSAVSMAMAPIADKAGMTLVSLAMHPAIPDISPYVFRIFQSITHESEELANHAYNKLGLREIAVLYIGDVWGHEAFRAFEERFSALGGKISFSEEFPVKQRDFRDLLTKVAAVNPDATFLAAYGPGVITALRQHRELNVGGKILGNIGMSWDHILRGAGDAAEGVIIVMPEFIAHEKADTKFVKAYRQKHGEEPNNESAFTYDAFQIILKAIERGGYSGTKIRDFILSLEKYEGVSGTFLFKPNGDTIMESVAIRTVKDGQLIRVSR